MKLKLLVAAVILAILSAGAGIYYFRFYKPVHDAEAAFGEAQAALSENRLVEGKEGLDTAFQLHPGHPQAGFTLFDLIYLVEPERAEALLAEMENYSLPRQGLISRKILMALNQGELGKAQALEKILITLDSLEMEGEFARLLLSFSADGLDREDLEKLELLRSKYPESRELKYLESRVLLTLDNDPITRVQGKVTLLSLLEKMDAISLRAAFLLAGSNRVTLFDTDWAEVGSHLKNHPFLEDGLALMDSGTLRGLAARFLSRDPEFSFQLTSQLVSRERSAPGDILLHVEAGQASGNLEQVLPYLQDLEAKENRSLEALLILAKQALTSNQVSSGMQYLEEAMALDPENPSLLRLLLSLSREPGNPLDPEDRIRVSEWIFQHAEADFSTRAGALQTRIELQPENRESILDRAVQTFAQSEPLQLSRWLNRMNAPERVLQLIPREEALQDLESFTARYDALMRLDKVDTLLEFLEAGQGLLSPLNRELSLAQVHLMQEEGDPARNHLENAFALANEQENPSVYFILGDLAGQLGDRDLTGRFYDQAFERGASFPSRAAVNYLGLLLDQENMEKAARFAAISRNRSPRNPIFINNDCYLQVLGEENLDSCIEDMRELVAQYPEVPQFRGTLALAQLLGGYPESALDTVSDKDRPYRPESAQGRMVFAMVQSANGQGNLARNLVEQMDRSQLNPYEAALLDRYFSPNSQL